MRRLALACVLLLTYPLGFSPLRAGDGKGGDAKKEAADFFFEVEGARDAVFDHVRQRLYVTTPKQLVVLDVKARKKVEAIDLIGGVRAIDISMDGKYLAVAPAQGQHLYWIGLDDLEITQVRFRAKDTETGVHDLCVGADGSVLFSMTYAGSGGVSLRRFDPKLGKVEVVAGVSMDSVVTASGDRRYAAVAEGNTSSGPLKLYDFQERTLSLVANLRCFHFEMACARGARYFARPHGKGCDLYDARGGKLGTLEGKPVIAAAFHPTADRLFVMRHGELGLQEYDVEGRRVAAEYPLDRPLAIKGDVDARVIANLLPVGRDAVIAHFRRVVQVHYRTFQSGRVRVADDGSRVLAILPTGVYVFAVRPPADRDQPKRKIKILDAD